MLVSWRAWTAAAACLAVLLGTLRPADANKVHKTNRKITVDIRARTAFCTKDKCRHMKEFENENCVNRCLSEGCFADIYGAEPLEPGEVDTRREVQFRQCLRRETKEALLVEKTSKYRVTPKQRPLPHT